MTPQAELSRLEELARENLEDEVWGEYARCTVSLIEELRVLRDLVDRWQDHYTAVVEGELECRGDEDCDHCVGIELRADSRQALKEPTP